MTDEETWNGPIKNRFISKSASLRFSIHALIFHTAYMTEWTDALHSQKHNFLANFYHVVSFKLSRSERGKIRGKLKHRQLFLRVLAHHLI